MDDTARIELRRPDGPSLWAVVDAADVPLVSRYRWAVLTTKWGDYARCRQPHLLMHRLILDAPRGLYVDHVNHDGLDNRRSNLRLATNQQNQANMRPMRGKSSQYKGVSWQTAKGTWKAQIKVGGVSRRLGAYASESDAALAYDAAAREAFGEFAQLNFPNHLAA